MPYYVYLMSSRRHGTLYLGVTNDLSRPVYEHKTKAHIGFTSRYEVERLVWCETHECIEAAIAREKALKKWRRDWKLVLIESFNPDWADLYPSLAG